MYKVVDSNGIVLDFDLPNKKEAKIARDKYDQGTAFLQRTDKHPRGASHLPQPKKPKFGKPEDLVTDTQTEPVKLTDEEIEAEAERLEGFGYKTANGTDGVPIWKQRVERKVDAPSASAQFQPRVIDFSEDPTFA